MAKPTDMGLLLQLIERARGLGLEVELTRATRTLRFQTTPDGETGIWANEYSITAWAQPRGSKNNQGHNMMSVYTPAAAEQIAQLWAKHTTRSNNYYTIGKESKLFCIRELKRFLALREEEEREKIMRPKLLPHPVNSTKQSHADDGAIYDVEHEEVPQEFVDKHPHKIKEGIQAARQSEAPKRKGGRPRGSRNATPKKAAAAVIRKKGGKP
jgi:hypothetical protein